VDGRNIIVGIAGRRGSGKSTIARKILERCERLLIYDAMGEHGWIPNLLESFEDLERFFGWVSLREKFAGRYVPHGDLVGEFSEFAWLVYEQGDLMLGVEEIPMLCSPGALPPDLDRLVRLGRHKGVSIVYTAQRLTEVARRLTAATDVFVMFSNTEPRDLAGLSERCGTAVARRVAALSRHGYLIWDAAENREVELESLLETVCRYDRSEDAVSAS